MIGVKQWLLIRRAAAGLACLIIGVGLFEIVITSTNKSQEPVQVWMPWVPTSMDPFDYDSFAHHVSARSLIGSLVTQYKTGEFIGLLADHWGVSEDKKIWTFHIRPGIQFENGDLVTADIIVKSWVRLAVLLNKKQSHSDFFSLIEGMDQLSSLSQTVPGLVAGNDSVTIRLKKPFSKTLETLSFGLYGIVHPVDYDSATGNWIDKKKIISSNAYRLKSWNKDSIELEMRPSFLPQIVHPLPIRKLKLVWDSNSKDLSKIVVSDSNDRSMPKNFTFYGGSPSGIVYGRCLSWKLKDGLCSTQEGRLVIRDLLYQSLEAQGIQPVRSFFPLGMQGIKSMTINRTESPIRLTKPTALKIFYRKKTGNEIFEKIRSQISDTGKKNNIAITEVDMPPNEFVASLDPDLTAYKADIALHATGVLIEDPASDIRFMVLSKEGIRLPDTDGRIREEIGKEGFSPQRVNEIIWDQGVVFPLGHFAMGVWATDELDLHLLNSVLPPLEFQWIGFK